jgi:hypothetical protein
MFGLFSRKKKVSPEQFAEGLLYLAHVCITRTNKTFFDDISKMFIEVGIHKNKEEEINRRYWEIYYFLASVIMIKLEGYNKYKNIDLYSFFIDGTINHFYKMIQLGDTITDNDLKKEIKNTLFSRYYLYKKSLIDREPGPIYHLAKNFLSFFWVGDVTAIYSIITIESLHQIMDVIEIVMNLFNAVDSYTSSVEIIK